MGHLADGSFHLLEDATVEGLGQMAGVSREFDQVDVVGFEELQHITLEPTPVAIHVENRLGLLGDVKGDPSLLVCGNEDLRIADEEGVRMVGMAGSFSAATLKSASVIQPLPSPQ